VEHSECRAYLAALAVNSIDSVVTDPPYELNFMGRDWDRSGIANQVELWRAVYRVMKPGAHLLAFGGTRTSHRMVCAIEDAGFEIRDSLHWMYGSGFNKNRNCLKPAHEPICLARKPLAKTVAATIAAYGTGGINVEACRVGSDSTIRKSNAGTNGAGWGMGKQEHINGSTDGRWPPNVLLTHSADCVPIGARRVRVKANGGAHKATGIIPIDNPNPKGYADADGTETIAAYACAPDCPVAALDGHRSASRFYPILNYDPQYDNPALYCAKASRHERGAGNHHPTVKPVALCRWLVRLVCPPGGTVLDSFAGSGSVGVACVLEGFNYLGCDQDAEYVEIANRRIMATQPALIGV
jgi:site-specific DNA-methyltransferase (adenine-specific)